MNRSYAISPFRSWPRRATAQTRAQEGVSSGVEAILECDPARVYAEMDAPTRKRYRYALQELARAAGLDELAVARAAIELAVAGLQLERSGSQEEGEPGNADPSCIGHVGYYLLDAGRPQLEAHLGVCPAPGTRLRRWLARRTVILYLGTVALLTLLVVGPLAACAAAAGGTARQLLGTSGLLFLLAVSFAVYLVNWLVTLTVPPRQLPRLAFREGIPAECRTMVVVPALLSSMQEVTSLLQRLEVNYRGNRTAHLTFALLTDFADAQQKQMPGDGALLAHAQRGILALNREYGRGDSGPFYLFHRERRWNPAEGCWMGWERKRGKLSEFNRLLTGSSGTSYCIQVGDLDLLPSVRYVITLDADTVLPNGAAQRLVATLAHPLNRAKFDPASGRPVAGYTVLQPRIEIEPGSATVSPFARIFGRYSPLDPYTHAVSEVYQDLFGEAIFAGKGIYDVRAFERALDGRVPENRLLSHDLFEGIQGRTGLVADIVLLEAYPPTYLAYLNRLHRWVRGDWQLLPWLLPRVPHAVRGRVANDLSLLDRWKIADNLRRSLLAPSLLALLLACWLGMPGSPLAWTLLALTLFAAPLILDLVAGLAHRFAGKYHALGAEEILRWLLILVFLPAEALVSLDAVIRTLLRLAVTRRHLLQWTTSSQATQRLGSAKALSVWQRMLGGPLLAVCLLLMLSQVNPTALPVAAPLILAWLLSPAIAFRLGVPERERGVRSTPVAASAGRAASRLADH